MQGVKKMGKPMFQTETKGEKPEILGFCQTGFSVDLQYRPCRAEFSVL
jgi:hypothetical protein